MIHAVISVRLKDEEISRVEFTLTTRTLEEARQEYTDCGYIVTDLEDGGFSSEVEIGGIQQTHTFLALNSSEAEEASLRG